MKLRSSYEMKVYLEIQFRKLILDREKPSVSGLLAKISELTKLVQGDISHIPENLEPTKKQPSPVVESSPQKTEPTPPVLDKPKQNIELEAKPNPQKQEQAPPTKPATASPAASEDMEKLLKEKFSGMEVDPNQFKNL